MSLINKWESFIETEKLFSKKDRLLVAVSGGVDSVVLCELCKQAGYNFSIAHCNFQLRGAESKGDEQFVEALAKEYGVAYFVKTFETENYAAQNHLSIQVAARELRYNWFKELLKMEAVALNPNLLSSTPKEAAKLLLTAHHADDNIETILMNFFKGSGINGLKGMLPKQFGIVRPLLFATKEEITAFANHQKINYREDSSNTIDKYTRNYFRNQLIPGLEKVFPKVKQNLLGNAVRFKEINEVYQGAIAQLKTKLIVEHGAEIHIPVMKLLKTSPLATVLYEITKDFGFSPSQISEVEKLLHSESGKYIESTSHRILRNRKWLIIAPLNNEQVFNLLVKECDTTHSFPLGELSFTTATEPGKIETDHFTAQLDAKNVTFPLLVRKWKKGDYFYPLGMLHKKKISRFLNDLKCSVLDREKIWVIESDKKIIWVIGKRIDNRFKLVPSSKNSLRILLRPAE